MILSALWKVYEFPEEYKPSLEQFSSLVKVCSGVLSASPFPEVHRRMMDLDLPIPSREEEGQRCSEPADVAKALRGVFDITTEKHNRITVVGGSSCSFVAAISHWLFDLTTYVEDENGKVLFAPSIGECPIDPITAKVHVQYGSATTASMIDISSTSYGIGNIRDIIALDDERSLTLRSRVPWDLALSLVFGGIFLKLMKAPKLLGSLLGSIARVTLALAVGERDVGDCDRGAFVDFTEASYGHGFINSVSQTFPELSSSELRQHMEDAAATTFKVAYGQIQTDLDMLQYHCKCRTCRELRLTESSGGCSARLAVTIARTVSMVSSLRFHTELPLHPTVEGLRNIYQATNVHDFRRHIRTPGYNYSGSLNYEDSYDWNTGLNQVLDLFTGFRSGGSPAIRDDTAIIACHHEGICVFAEIAVDLTSHANKLRQIHVIPGHINRIGNNPRAYAKIQDRIVDLTQTSSTLKTATLLRGPDVHTPARHPEPSSSGSSGNVPSNGAPRGRLENPDRSRPKECAATFLVTQEVVELAGAGMLSLFYRACDTDGGYIILRPGSITIDLLRGSRRVWCDKHQCTSMVSEAIELFTVQQGWRVDRSIRPDENNSSHGLRCLDWTNLGLKDLELLVALASCDESLNDGWRCDKKEEIFVSHGECLPCHLAAASALIPEVPGPGASATAVHSREDFLRRVACFI